MSSTITALTSGGGLAMAGDTSGQLELKTNNGTTAVTIDTSQNLQFNSGYGSVATAYGCRAWVNFNGTGTVAIRASGNVSSITDNGVGDYTVNFTNAMPDANYSFGGFCVISASRSMQFGDNPISYAAGSLRVATGAITAFGGETTKYDANYVNINVFR